MRKVRVWKDDFTGSWRVQSGSLLLDPDSVAARCPTHAEALFLAQLLADPHEYIRESQAAVWEECAEEYCDYEWNSAGRNPFDPPRNPYWKDKTND